ncbi:hypothetical protein JCM8097_000569 [Rhodosporidiobolus ruineniae]
MYSRPTITPFPGTFALELVKLIADQVEDAPASFPPSEADRATRVKARQRTGRHLACVCRAWGPIGQDLVYRSVELRLLNDVCLVKHLLEHPACSSLRYLKLSYYLSDDALHPTSLPQVDARTLDLNLHPHWVAQGKPNAQRAWLEFSLPIFNPTALRSLSLELKAPVSPFLSAYFAQAAHLETLHLSPSGELLDSLAAVTGVLPSLPSLRFLALHGRSLNPSTEPSTLSQLAAFFAALPRTFVALSLSFDFGEGEAEEILRGFLEGRRRAAMRLVVWNAWKWDEAKGRGGHIGANWTKREVAEVDEEEVSEDEEDGEESDEESEYSEQAEEEDGKDETGGSSVDDDDDEEVTTGWTESRLDRRIFYSVVAQGSEAAW